MCITKVFPIGTGTIALRDLGAGRYDISSEVESSLLATLIYPYTISGHSLGRFVDGIPRPDSYRQWQAIAGEEHTAEAEFNWHTKRVLARYDARQRRLRLRPRVVDPLSLFALAMVDLQNGVTAEKYRLSTVSMCPLTGSPTTAAKPCTPRSASCARYALVDSGKTARNAPLCGLPPNSIMYRCRWSMKNTTANRCG